MTKNSTEQKQPAQQGQAPPLSTAFQKDVAAKMKAMEEQIAADQKQTQKWKSEGMTPDEKSQATYDERPLKRDFYKLLLDELTSAPLTNIKNEADARASAVGLFLLSPAFKKLDAKRDHLNLKEDFFSNLVLNTDTTKHIKSILKEEEPEIPPPPPAPLPIAAPAPAPAATSGGYKTPMKMVVTTTAAAPVGAGKPVYGNPGHTIGPIASAEPAKAKGGYQTPMQKITLPTPSQSLHNKGDKENNPPFLHSAQVNRSANTTAPKVVNQQGQPPPGLKPGGTGGR